MDDMAYISSILDELKKPHGCENGLHSWQKGQDIMGMKRLEKKKIN
jgi:hypothetical protein